MPIRRVVIGPLDLLVVVRPGSFLDRAWKGLMGLLGRRPPAAAEGVVAPPTSTGDAEADALARRVAEVQWYHTIDLGHGVVTPGAFDHRPHLHQYELPERVDGLRVLDVATFDGFWAFEFERRGAAEVVGIDVARRGDLDLLPAVRARLSQEELDAPVGRGFEVAKEALGSSVRRERLSVYDLSPERVGTFDIVYMGSLLLHLTCPIKALQNVASVTKGYALIAECFHPVVPDKLAHYQGGRQESVWWFFGLECLEEMIRDAGFSRVERHRVFGVPERGDHHLRWHAVFKAYK
ncbi:MAG: methyltransferase domain-containing protein [Ectothiorhodospiraceae bacterium]|nr:methyltransferase domain-containing protein [Ectothiorhodospiraceae bacterium]